MLAKNRFRSLLLGSATLLTALLGVTLASPAQANLVPTISFAVSQDNGNLTQIGSTTTGIGSFTFGTADFIGTVSAIGAPILPQGTLDTSSIDARSSTNGNKTLYIYVTEQHLTASNLMGLDTVISGFTANLFTDGVVSVTENTYISFTDALWTGAAMGTQTFTGLGSTSMSHSVFLNAPFSETAEFIVKINGSGSVNDTINMSVPEPMSMALLGSGLIGLGVIRRAKRAV
jgi:PEP-CTERM motif